MAAQGLPMYDPAEYEYVGVSYGESQETFDKLIELYNLREDRPARDYIMNVINSFPVKHILRKRKVVDE